jgi:hypothetical protein
MTHVENSNVCKTGSRNILIYENFRKRALYGPQPTKKISALYLIPFPRNRKKTFLDMATIFSAPRRMIFANFVFYIRDHMLDKG